VHRSATAGDVHRYTLLLVGGQFLSLEAEQLGSDIALTLFGPGGGRPLAVDSPNGEKGMERLETVVGESGLYVLKVSASGPRGSYTLRVTRLRSPSPTDLRLAAASMAYFEAETRRRRGKDAKADVLAAYRQALTLAERAKDLRWQALALHRVGQVSEGLERQAEALAAYQASLGLYRRCGDRWEQALLFYAIGRVQRRLNNSQEALAAYQAALTRFAELGDVSRQASALNDLGLIHADRGALQEAIDCYGGALLVWRRIGNSRSEAVTLKNLGDVYASLRHNQRATQLFRRALMLHRAAREEQEEALVLESLGTVQRRAAAYKEALVSFDRALTLMHRHGDRHGEAIVLNSQGATHFQMGHLERARDLYAKALALAQEIAEPGTQAYARINLGWLEEVQGRPQAACVHHRAALAILRRQGDRRGEISALFGLARAERKRGRLAVARSWAEAALARIELLRNAVENEEVQWTFLADRHNYYEFLVDLLIEMSEAQGAEDLAVRALQVSERGRARALLDRLRSGRADLALGVSPELLAREREVAAKLRAAELRRLQRDPGGRGGTADLDAAINALSDELYDLWGRIRVQNPSYASLVTAEVPSLREIRSQLDDETLLLEISLGEERSFLWLVGRKTLLHRILPGRKEIEAQARRARQLLQESHIPLYRRQLELVLQDLSQTLLAPVAGHLGTRRLVIVADGVLQLIPFAALPLPASTAAAGVPLVAWHEIVHLPSIAILRLLREREAARPVPPKTLAVFGDPVFHLGEPRISARRGRQVDEDAAETGFSPSWFRALPSSRREADAILAMVPSAQRLGALNFDANLDGVLKGELRNYRILHFATHGLLNHEHPDLSGIALSPLKADGSRRDAILWAHQVYGLDLPVELVVLSACQTALGKEVRGEGVVGLTQGFMHAGATRVLVSLWNVSDEATAELMTRFYRAHLRQGLPAAAALRNAQLSLLADGRWSSPYHWAGLVLQGDWT
jgi:CHAT domain-containing protein